MEHIVHTTRSIIHYGVTTKYTLMVLKMKIYQQPYVSRYRENMRGILPCQIEFLQFLILNILKILRTMF